MGWTSIEVKARCPDPARVRRVLKSRRADFKGTDRQIDAYFRVPSGRLKLREGNIENALIYYKRADKKGSKRCDSFLWDLSFSPFRHKASDGPVLRRMRSSARRGRGKGEGGDRKVLSSVLKRVLETAMGVFTVVDKRREIYFLGNVKFHIDRVKGLGNFVEIEAQDRSGKLAAEVRRQCEFYQRLLGIRKKDLLADSYSDQLLKKGTRKIGDRH